MARDIAVPQLLLPAGNDNDNVRPGGEVIQQLLNNNGDIGHSSYCFERMQHGWVTRGSLSDKEGIVIYFLPYLFHLYCLYFFYSYYDACS